MYLALLNRKQKDLFMDFAYHLASMDGDYGDEEKVMMQGYCYEMQIDYDEKKTIKSIEKILSEINIECDVRTKKIFVFEAIGLAMCDNSYDESERQFIRSAISSFGMEKDFDLKCEKVLDEYKDFQNRINELVIG